MSNGFAVNRCVTLTSNVCVSVEKLKPCQEYSAAMIQSISRFIYCQPQISNLSNIKFNSPCKKTQLFNLPKKVCEVIRRVGPLKHGGLYNVMELNGDCIGQLTTSSLCLW